MEITDKETAAPDGSTVRGIQKAPTALYFRKIAYILTVTLPPIIQGLCLN